jgi:hypothetical protein
VDLQHVAGQCAFDCDRSRERIAPLDREAAEVIAGLQRELANALVVSTTIVSPGATVTAGWCSDE